jgi:opacity protein-like surface antigen
MKRSFVILAAVLVLVPAAHADTTQAVGPIVALRIQHHTSDTHAQFHGTIKVGDPIGGYAEYRWGGSSCPGLTLDVEIVDRLQRGMNNPRILIQPYTKQGQGSVCLVGYTLILRSDLGALP